jgi:anti-sigma regulatory factor (Ser/Thr protein kinase)
MCTTTPRAECELPISYEAPALARSFLRSSTCVEHHSSVVEDAVLLVSELVTNSVLHGGPPVVVAVDCDGEALQVRVRDGSPTLPEPRDAGQDAESGRGLELVANLSAAWGVDPEDGGKHVWFVLQN